MSNQKRVCLSDSPRQCSSSKTQAPQPFYPFSSEQFPNNYQGASPLLLIEINSEHMRSVKGAACQWQFSYLAIRSSLFQGWQGQEVLFWAKLKTTVIPYPCYLYFWATPGLLQGFVQTLPHQKHRCYQTWHKMLARLNVEQAIMLFVAPVSNKATIGVPSWGNQWFLVRATNNF